MRGRSFLLLHGWEGSGPQHWQTWLATRLRRAGENVRYPLLPDPIQPKLDLWLEALRRELDAMPGERIVLCHSLGCLLWLQHARDCDPAHRAGRVLLVAPPGPEFAIPGVVGFVPVPTTPQQVRMAADVSRIVAGDDDPFNAGGSWVWSDALHVPVDVIAQGGHLHTDAGYGPWPAVERWALDGSVPLTGAK